MTLLKDNNYKDINVALLSLEADIKNKITGSFDTSEIDKQLAEINSRIDKINAGSNNASAEINDIRTEIENINSKLIGNSVRIENIEQKLSDIFSAENKVTDFNTTTTSGIYYWTTDAANKPSTDYGVLLVNKYDGGSNSLWLNQVAYGTNNKIYFRQNINSSGWTEWKAVAFDGEITAKKVANALTVNGKTYDGSSAVDAGVQTVANGGTGVTTQADINKAFISNLDVSTSDVTDGTEFVSSYASDNGFAETAEGSLHKPYKRQFVKVWNYIKSKISSVLGLTKDNYGGKASTAVTADYANRLTAFASWNNPYEYDATNGVRVYVYKITMASWFNSILVQTYDDINYARCRRYVLDLWHANDYGYNVCVTDLGGTKDSGLHVWMGTDGNIYLQADVYWTSRIAFSRLDDITDVTITKIGVARYGSNADINGNVLFTPLADPIVDCGALRADDSLSSASKVPQILKTDVLRASSRLIIPIGAPSSPQDGDIWIER